MFINRQRHKNVLKLLIKNWAAPSFILSIRPLVTDNLLEWSKLILVMVKNKTVHVWKIKLLFDKSAARIASGLFLFHVHYRKIGRYKMWR